MTIEEIKRRGYCVTSRKYGMLSRIDRPDWKEAMAEDHSPWDLTEGMQWVRLLGLMAEDHYRRVYSKDNIEPKDIPRSVLFREIPNSSGTVTGYCEAGYLIGREDGRRESQAIEAQCDTDEDCYDKYGCGGYADPCENEHDEQQ